MMQATPPRSMMLSSSEKESSLKHDDSVLDRSSLVSRNVTIGAHRTSIRLEPDMWNGLREICLREHVTMHDIATAVSAGKPDNASLTAAIRVFIMAYFRAAATEDGHSRAGHGPGGSFMAGLSDKPRMSAVSRMGSMIPANQGSMTSSVAGAFSSVHRRFGAGRTER